MKFVSKRLGEIDLNVEEFGGEVLITHDALEEVAYDNGLTFDFLVLKDQIGHGLVKGTITAPDGTKINQLGEALDVSLVNDISRSYPVTMAMNRAYDRAVIRYLMIPGKVYSVSEIEQGVSDTTNKTVAPEISEGKLKEEEKSLVDEEPKKNIQKASEFLITLGPYKDKPTKAGAIVKNPKCRNWIDMIIDRFSSAEDVAVKNQALTLKWLLENGGKVA